MIQSNPFAMQTVARFSSWGQTFLHQQTLAQGKIFQTIREQMNFVGTAPHLITPAQKTFIPPLQFNYMGTLPISLQPKINRPDPWLR